MIGELIAIVGLSLTFSALIILNDKITEEEKRKQREENS